MEVEKRGGKSQGNVKYETMISWKLIDGTGIRGVTQHDSNENISAEWNGKMMARDKIRWSACDPITHTH